MLVINRFKMAIIKIESADDGHLESIDALGPGRRILIFGLGFQHLPRDLANVNA